MIIDGIEAGKKVGAKACAMTSRVLVHSEVVQVNVLFT